MKTWLEWLTGIVDNLLKVTDIDDGLKEQLVNDLTVVVHRAASDWCQQMQELALIRVRQLPVDLSVYLRAFADDDESTLLP